MNRKKKGNRGQKLSTELDSITGELGDVERNDEKKQRAVILGAMKKYSSSRFELGKALAGYKFACHIERVWLRASKAIAKHIGRSQRTVFRILADYERVAGVPDVVLDALHSEGFDPAEAKNAPLLGQVIEIVPADSSPEQAQEAVRDRVTCLKQHKPKSSTTEDAQVIQGLRLDMRRRLNNIPNGRKHELLQRAITEEVSEVWGILVPLTFTITPKPAASLIADRRQKRNAAAA